MATAWVKDTVSQSPRTVYIAPEDAWPTVRIIHDPDADYPWSVVYGRLSVEGQPDTKADVEAVMGL